MTRDFQSSVVSTLTSHILEARVSGKPVSVCNLLETELTTDEAYTIQAEVARQIGSIGGFKVANKPNSRIMAPIFQDDISNSPLDLEVPHGEAIGIELEIGFRIDSPLPSLDTPNRQSVIAQKLSAVAVIEIVRTRLPGEASPELKLADNQINGGLVVGTPVKNWRPESVGDVEGFLSLGDDIVLSGAVTVPGGNAFENFLVLEKMIGNHCGGLKPGQVIITGSLNGLPYVQGNIAIRGEITGLGSVSVDLRRTS
jgi:2-keto-4-pentenoate hydratase